MAKTANEQLQDLQISNQHLVEDYKNEIISTMLLFFRRMEKLIDKEIASSYNSDGVLIVPKTELKKKLLEIQTLEMNKMYKRIIKDVEKFLGIHARNYEKQLKDVLKELSDIISVKSVEEKTLKRNYEKELINLEKGNTNTLSSLWNTLILKLKTNLQNNVSSAYSLDKSRRDFSEDVKGSYKISESQLDAVIAVMVQQAVGVAYKSVNNANSGFLRGYVWDATIDSRTSPFCLEHNQRYWIYDRPDLSTLEYEFYPPSHYRCRSLATPIVKSYEELGLSESDLTQEQLALIPDSNVGTFSYVQWLEKQPDSIKKEVLGVVRFKAYQEGNLELASVYTNSGRKLTLAELKKKQVKFNEEYLRYIKE